MQIRILATFCITSLIIGFPALAGDQEVRFIEFPGTADTVAFDLNTVRLVQPGRFTVVSTTIDDPDFMHLELQTLDVLRSYCSRTVGKYPAPAELLAFGRPDLPVQSIEVHGTPTWHTISWRYPYRRFELGDADREAHFFCQGPSKTQEQLYNEMRSDILNGSRSKMLFDCGRALSGLFFREDDDVSEVHTAFVKKGTVGEHWYLRVCQAVTHERPYIPR